MKFMTLFNRRARYFVAAISLVFAAMMPGLVSADQVTERSIALSSSSVDAQNVTYTVNFTATKAAGAFVVDFCSNSPVIGEACTSPADAHNFSASAAASTTTGFTSVTALDAHTVVVTGTIAAAATVSVDLTGINNPDNAGPLYARIVTYDTQSNASQYTSTDLKSGAQDEGGVAMAITPTIGVSAAVLESMTFCVSGESIGDSCVGTGSKQPALAAPTLKLGQDNGGVIALNADDVYTGVINTQISTNAVSGAVINLKSNALRCGGLINSSKKTDCYIKPALKTDIVKGQAKFGVKTGADDVDATNGTIEAVKDSGYGATSFAMNWVTGDTTGVTSTYGDPLLDTDGKPANNKNMPLTFGASVSNQTPAGLYSADLSLIATGRF